MKYIVIFSTHWGFQEGGINSFNYDFTMGLASVIDKLEYRIIVIPYYDPMNERAEEARALDIQICPLRKNEDEFLPDQDFPRVKEIINNLPDVSCLYFVGHDVFTGPLANSLAHEYPGSASIVFHHMDYLAYYSIKGKVNPGDNNVKITRQRSVLKAASVVIGVGPLLTSSAKRMAEGVPVYGIIPGLQQITPRKDLPEDLIAITFGRYDARTDRLKQMKLAARAFAEFVEEQNRGKANKGTLKIVGFSDTADADAFKDITIQGIDLYVNLFPLPYTPVRSDLMNNLRESTLCLMLSVQDGFGLVGLEAIAAGVPLILSMNCGLYQFLAEQVPPDKLRDFGVYAVGIGGSGTGEINKADLVCVKEAIRDIALHIPFYRNGVSKLRQKLIKRYTWTNAGKSFLKNLKKIKTAINAPVKKPELDSDASARLPRPLSTLIGRTNEVDIIKELQSSGKTRLVSISGMGGAGKTSLAALWLKTLPARRRVTRFEWSFHSQGNGHIIVSTEVFFERALSVFGDLEPAHGTIAEKATRLARLIEHKKGILILDGLEPLQHAIRPLKGYINDLGVRLLIQHISKSKHGFCIITTREKITDLEIERPDSYYSLELPPLDEQTAIALLKQFNLTGDELKFKAAVKHFNRHPLSLVLLGSWLQYAENGRIGKYLNAELFKEDEQLGSPFANMMRRYDDWLPAAQKQYLRLLGFFTQPAEMQEIEVLLEEPVLPGFNDLLPRSADAPELKIIHRQLQDRYLLMMGSNDNSQTDTHPMIREYQQTELKKVPEIWKEGNRRLYKYYSEAIANHHPDSIKAIVQLYIAAQHGCLAGLHEEVFRILIKDRIWRGNEHYSTNTLGMLDDELAVLRFFFETPYSKPVSGFPKELVPDLTSQAGLCLKSTMQLLEAVAPYETTLTTRLEQNDLENALIACLNLSQLNLCLGKLQAAISYSMRAVEYCKDPRPMQPVWKTAPFTNLAMCFTEAGDSNEASKYLVEAEDILKQVDPEALHLYSMRGYHKCEWIFSVIESQVWADWLEGKTTSNYKQDLDAIREIAQYGLDRASNTPYIKGLYYLELAKADIFAYAVGEQHNITSVDASLTEAERLLVRARVGFDLPRIYIAKASLYRCQAKKTGDLKLLEQTSTELSKAAEIVRFAKLPLYDLQLQMEKAKIFFVSGKMHELKLILTNAGDLIDRYGFLRYKSDLENLWRVVD